MKRLKKFLDKAFTNPLLRCPVWHDCPYAGGVQCELRTCERRRKAIQDNLNSTRAT